ncbi:hypothetical protein D3C84_1205290 [compost metagenome]
MRGDVQAIGTPGPLLGRVLLPQLVDQRVGGRRFVTEEPRGFCQARTNAFAQLFGGGIGEGHHQNLGWEQFTAETTFTAMAKDQAQV